MSSFRIASLFACALLVSPAHAGKKKRAAEAAAAEAAAAAETTAPVVYAVRVSLGGAEGKTVAEVLGDDGGVASARQRLSELVPDGFPEELGGDGWPGAAAAAATGWGESPQAATRNALGRLETVLIAREDRLLSVAIMGMGGQDLPNGDFPGYTKDADDELRGQELAAAIETLTQARMFLPHLAVAGEAEELALGTPVATFTPASDNDAHRTGIEPGQSLVVRGSAVGPAGVDALASEACGAMAANGLTLTFEAVANASAETKTTIAAAGTTTVHGAMERCLQGMTVAME